MMINLVFLFLKVIRRALMAMFILETYDFANTLNY